MRSGKMEFETLAKILLLTAFLIVVLLMFKGCVDAYTDLGGVGVKEYTCWATNVMKANVIQIWPSTCRTQIVKEQSEMKSLGKLMGTCWWMFGQGKWDLGGKIDESTTSLVIPLDLSYTCYVFTPKEDIKVNALKDYMKQYNVKGEKAKKTEDVMWNYLQVASKGDNVCFDKEDKGVLKKGEVYYMKFVDNRAWISTGKSDMLVVSRNKESFEYRTAYGRAVDWFKKLIGINPCYDYSPIAEEKAKPTGDDLEKSEKKSAEDLFNTFINSIKECKALAKGSICRCAEYESESIKRLPENAEIRATQEENNIKFNLYYANKEMGKQASVSGNLLVYITSMGQPDFKKISKEFIFRGGGNYYLLLTKNSEEIAASTIPLNPLYYPTCKDYIKKLGEDINKVEDNKKQAETFFNSFLTSIKECKSLVKGSICRCSEGKIDFVNGLPSRASIKATPNQDQVTFKLYYDDQQIGSQEGETIPGKIALQTSSILPLAFKKLEEELVFTNERPYYLLLTKNADEFAISAIPISTSYPICK